MKIWIKIGTLPADVLSMGRRRRAPVVGERLEVQERNVTGPSRVECDAIKVIDGRPLYYVSRL